MRRAYILYFLCIATPAILAITLLTSHAQDKDAVEDVEKRAQAWIDGLGEKGYEVEIRELNPGKGFAPYCHFNSGLDCSKNPRASLMIYQEDNRYMSIGFTIEPTPQTTLEELQKSVKYIALNQLPTPGLEAKGWRIRPLTPVSSFSEGVSITGYDGKRIQITVETEFFAIYGHATTPACQPPADAPSPKGCYFEIKHKLPGHITIDLPVFTAP